MIGILGWFLSGTILKKEMIPESQMGMFDKLYFLFRLADILTFRTIGLSTIAVGRV